MEVLPENSWFREYLSVWPLAESPKPFLLFSAMAAFGSVVGRRCWFDGDIHKTYPLMNLVLVGPSGIGKSTAIHMAVNNLVRPLPDEIRPQIITGKSTKEALHEDLFIQPQSLIVASELANLFSKEKYQEGMIPYVTDLLDLNPASVRTKGGGPAKIIREPACAVVGGTTKEWLQDMLPNTANEGGFLPRFFLVKEDYKAQRVADPRRMMNERQRFELDKLRAKVFGVFRAFTTFHAGLVDFEDYEASDAYSIWYNSYTPDTGTLAPFAARAGAHVIRLAMLSALSCARPSISADDVRAAIALHEYSMKKLHEVIVPMTPAGRMVNKLLEALGHESMSEVQLKRAMRNYCSGSDVSRMLLDLVQSNDVVVRDGLYRRTN